MTTLLFYLNERGKLLSSNTTNHANGDLDAAVSHHSAMSTAINQITP